MKKAEFVAKIAEKSGLTRKQAEMALAAFTQAVTEALKDGDKVQLTGFGTFEVKDRPERIARNPQAPDQEITIPASKAPVFKAGKSLKEAVNK